MAFRFHTGYNDTYGVSLPGGKIRWFDEKNRSEEERSKELGDTLIRGFELVGGNLVEGFELVMESAEQGGVNIESKSLEDTIPTNADKSPARRR